MRSAAVEGTVAVEGTGAVVRGRRVAATIEVARAPLTKAVTTKTERRTITTAIEVRVSTSE